MIRTTSSFWAAFFYYIFNTFAFIFRYLATLLIFFLFIFSLIYELYWVHLLIFGIGIALLFGLSFYGAIIMSYLLRDVWDQRVEFIFREVKNGKRPRFILYLRPFNVDMGWVDFQSGRPWWYPPARIFEPWLAFALERYAPVVALIRNIEDYDFAKSNIKRPDMLWADQHLTAVGAGRFSVDEWRQDVLLSMQACLKILIVPLPSDELIWELNRIKEMDLLNKCVFVMPPESRSKFTEKKWNQAVREYHHVGIELPAYDRSGLLFTVENNGAVRHTMRFPKSSIFFLRHSLKQLMTEKQQSKIQ